MKKKNVIMIILIVAILGVGMFFAISHFSSKESDAKKFSKEYHEVTEDNVFVYRTKEEIIKILKHGTGVVYLGFPECGWCQAYVKILNEVAKEEKLEQIYYYNVLEDRSNNTKEYQEMVSILKEHLQYDDEGNPRIYVPNVSFHVDGTIVGNDYETSKDTHGLKEPEKYWTKEEVEELKETLRGYMKKVIAAGKMCTNCNK